MATLIFVRHGETETNKKNILHKPNDPIGLNKKGKEQMKFVARAIQKYSPSVVYNSKEKRAVESAEIVSDLLNIPVEIKNGLEERNWGNYSGKSWKNVEKVLAPMNLEQRYTFIPPNGESWNEAEKRSIQVLKEITRKHKQDTIIIVTHGGILRILIPYLLNKPKVVSFKYKFENASISIFNLNNKKFTPKFINNTEHLVR
jgi:broad specificity phosphatase PhoE